MTTATADPPVVYVGIVTYNSAADLPACFAALRAQTYPHVRIAVLDNASTDGSADWVRQHAPSAILVTSPDNLGFGRGHNALMRALRLRPDDAYLTLNPDCLVQPAYIAEVLAAVRLHGAGMGVGKLLLPVDDDAAVPLIYSAGQGIRRDGYVVNVGQRMADDGMFDTPREVMFGSGAALLLTGALLADIAHPNLDQPGLGEVFDPGFFLYGEDVDVGWRARRAGWTCLYVPSAVAYHRGGSLSAETRTAALGNLCLSTLKNADTADLLMIHLSLIAINVLARLILAPRLGVRLAQQVMGGAGRALRLRRPARIDRATLHGWYAWSATQPTTQPAGIGARLRAYVGGRGRVRRV